MPTDSLTNVEPPEDRSDEPYTEICFGGLGTSEDPKRMKGKKIVSIHLCRDGASDCTGFSCSFAYL